MLVIEWIVFLATLVLWVWALVDVLRRNDLRGWAKIGIIVAILILPLAGSAFYLIFRRPGPERIQEADFPESQTLRGTYKEPGTEP